MAVPYRTVSYRTVGNDRVFFVILLVVTSNSPHSRLTKSSCSRNFLAAFLTYWNLSIKGFRMSVVGSADEASAVMLHGCRGGRGA